MLLTQEGAFPRIAHTLCCTQARRSKRAAQPGKKNYSFLWSLKGEGDSLEVLGPST